MIQTVSYVEDAVNKEQLTNRKAGLFLCWHPQSSSPFEHHMLSGNLMQSVYDVPAVALQ